MPKAAYTEAEREHVRQELADMELKHFAAQGIQYTAVERIYTHVGISCTFFSAKEDLVVGAFYRQQPQILAYAQSLMDDAALSWREGVEQFLRNLCYGGQNRFAIMSVEEQQALSKCLAGENRQVFQRRRLSFLTELLHILGLRTETRTVKLIGNLVFSAAIVCKALPDTLPFLFLDAANEMTVFQIDAILNFMEILRQQSTKELSGEKMI